MRCSSTSAQILPNLSVFVSGGADSSSLSSLWKKRPDVKGTIYLTVWRVETHHHRANCRKHKELPAKAEKFKYCPVSEESHHCLVIVFPVENLARDVGIMWQSSVYCWKNGLLGLLHGCLPAAKLVVSGLRALSPIHTFFMRVF